MGWQESFDIWLLQEIAENAGLTAESILLTGLYTAQWIIYYAKASDEIDKRDDVFDKEELINEELHRRFVDTDYPRALLRTGVVDLPLPDADVCSDQVLYVTETVADANPFSGVKDDVLDSLPNRVPSNWQFNDSQLSANASIAYAGSVLANSAKRQREEFRENKTSLVLATQRANRMDFDTFFKDLNVASDVYSGLANFYMQGLNSAGIGLGVQLGKFTGSSGQASQSSQPQTQAR